MVGPFLGEIIRAGLEGFILQFGGIVRIVFGGEGLFTQTRLFINLFCGAVRMNIAFHLKGIGREIS